MGAGTEDTDEQDIPGGDRRVEGSKEEKEVEEVVAAPHCLPETMFMIGARILTLN